MRKKTKFGVVMLLLNLIIYAQVGIGIDTPTSTLDINGDLRIRTLPEKTNTLNFDDLVVDGNGNVSTITKSSSTSFGGVVSGSSVSLDLNSSVGHLVTIRSWDACGRSMVSAFITVSNRLIFLNGQVNANQQTATIQNSGRSNAVTASNIANCADGTNGNWNYTMTINTTGTQLTLVNNSGNNRSYEVITSQL